MSCINLMMIQYDYLTCTGVEIGFVPNNGNVTEGVDRFLNLTAEVNSGELGLNVSVGIDIFPGGTAKSMLS